MSRVVLFLFILGHSIGNASDAEFIRGTDKGLPQPNKAEICRRAIQFSGAMTGQIPFYALSSMMKAVAKNPLSDSDTIGNLITSLNKDAHLRVQEMRQKDPESPTLKQVDESVAFAELAPGALNEIIEGIIAHPNTRPADLAKLARGLTIPAELREMLGNAIVQGKVSDDKIPKQWGGKLLSRVSKEDRTNFVQAIALELGQFKAGDPHLASLLSTLGAWGAEANVDQIQDLLIRQGRFHDETAKELFHAAKSENADFAQRAIDADIALSQEGIGGRGLNARARNFLGRIIISKNVSVRRKLDLMEEAFMDAPVNEIPDLIGHLQVSLRQASENSDTPHLLGEMTTMATGVLLNARLGNVPTAKREPLLLEISRALLRIEPFTINDLDRIRIAYINRTVNHWGTPGWEKILDELEQRGLQSQIPETQKRIGWTRERFNTAFGIDD